MIEETSEERELLRELETLRRRVAELEGESRELEVAERRRRLLATALEAVRQGVAITDARLEPPGPRLLFVNDHLCEMSGYGAHELAGEPLQVLFSRPFDRELLRQIESTLRHGHSFHHDLAHRRRDGSEFAVAGHLSPVFDPRGELTHLVSIQQDVTERRRADEALRHSEERYELLIERMNEGFLATDQSNYIDLVNAKLVGMLGYSAQELRGQYLGNFFDRANRAKLEEQEERRQHGVAEPYELTWTARDGRKIDTVISPTSLRDAEGRFIGSFAVVTDITERKRDEAERRRLDERIQKAQKMESLGLLAGGIAHDFNNLLVGVLGNAGLALMELSPGTPVHSLVRQIETAALRASELTNEMLAYSGKGKLLVEAINLSSLVREMAQLLGASISKKARLEFDFVDELPSMEGDPTQIRQVVMNLITNAAEALGDRPGQIILSTGETLADRAYLAGTYMDEDLDAGSYVYLEVTDDGSGMDPETRSRIFDPFFTTKFTGRGLGLAAVLGIVRGHHGAIKVMTEVEAGTSIRVLFPVAAASSTEAESPAAEEPRYESTGRILVVDDEPMVRQVCAACLEAAGYSVLMAADGSQAVEVFRDNGSEIDAILLDMTMPRMGGDEAYREIRKIRPDTKIIVTSGYNEQEAALRFAGLTTPSGAVRPESLDAFLQKPFQAKELIRKVERILGTEEG